MRNTLSVIALAALMITACSAPQGQIGKTSEAAPSRLDAAKLDAVLADPRRDTDRARDIYRHTAKTMAFFDIAPDANVVEVLPGGGWYTRVLLPYVSPDGGWYGINYSRALRRGILEYAGRDNIEENLAEYAGWPQTYPAMAAQTAPKMARSKGPFCLARCRLATLAKWTR